MSRRMAESPASQRGFFGNAGMHYMAHQSTASRDETPEDLLRDQHIALQERMRNPIAFHAKNGRYHVLSSGTSTTRCKTVCRCCCQGSEWTCRKQSLETYQVRGCPRRCASSTLGMVHAAQAQPHHQQDHKAQGQIESTWWKTGVWNELFRDLCTCCYLVCDQAYDSYGHHLQLGLTSSWLIPKLPLRRTSTWNFLKAFRLRLATPRTTCSSF